MAIAVRSLAIVMLGLTVASLGDSANAQIVNWQNTGGGWWDVNSNWVGGVRPGAAATARFGVNSTYNVDWDGLTGNTTTAGLQVAAGNVTFRSMGGPIYRHTVSGETLVETGGVFNLGASATNRFNLDTGSLKLQTGGILNVKFGSVLTSSGSVIVGHIGTGSQLNITGGSIVNVNNGAYIGGNSGATGNVLVSGALSHLNASGEVWVGDFGNGTLTIDSGGRVSSGRAYISLRGSSTSSATVTGASSQWTSSAEFTVGDTGNGTLNILDGGLVSNTVGYVGRNIGAVGLVNVSGTNSQWNNSTGLLIGAQNATTNGGAGTLNVGSGGRVQVGNDTFDSGSGSEMVIGDTVAANGALVLRNGSTINNGGTAYIGATSGKTGSASVVGSTWNNATGLFLGAQNATTNGGVGSLSVASGGRIQVGNDTFDSGTGSEMVIGDTVAANGTFVLRNGSSVTNAGSSYIGATSGKTGSAVVSVSTWTSGTGLFLGGPNATTNGGVGSLSVLIGGRVQIGNDTSGNGIVVGDTVAANGTLVVRNGSTISNTGNVYLGATSGRTGSAVVNGTGSQWTNSGEFRVGSGGVGSLSVEAGGLASGGYGYVGLSTGSTGTVTVSGAGSQWNTSNIAYVGMDGSGTLNLQNGGAATMGVGYIGYGTPGTGVVNVTGTGSRLTTTATNGAGLFVGYFGTGTVNITNGGRIQVGNDTFSSGSAAQMVIGDNSQAIGSMTIYRGTVNNSGSAYIGATSGKIGRVEVNGGNSVWNNATGLYLGAQNATTNGGLGILYAVNGGRVQIGNDAFDSGTTAELVVGDTVASNGTLTIRNGSIADIGGNSYLGASSGTTGSALVTGANSRWFNSLLTVGGSGNGTLNVENGGYVSGNTVNIGGISGSVGIANITETNSQFVGSTINVGLSGTGTLNVANGGMTSGANVNIGVNAGSVGIANVTGTNARLIGTNLLLGGQNSNTDGGSGALNIGTGGRVQIGNDNFDSGTNSELVIGGGTLTLRNGATISNDGSSYIGPTNTGVATITGSGTTWNNATGLYVGAQSTSVNGYAGTLNVLAGGRIQVGNDTFDSGTGAEMVIGDTVSGRGVFAVRSGTVTNAGGSYIGATSGKTGSAVVSGSIWTSGTGLFLGGPNATTNGGVGSLNVSNGGRVQIGNDTSGNGIVVGDSVAANGTLVVRNGSTISNTGSASIAATSGRTGSAVVTGTGSQWTNSSELRVGSGGIGSLSVEAGGLVSSGSGYVGLSTGSTGTVTVSGAGSQWNTSNIAYVGLDGSGSLNLQNGGAATMGVGFIGYGTPGTGVVNVTGTGSRLTTTSTNGAGLFVGYYGTGTVNITNGGRIQVGNDTFSSGTAAQMVIGDNSQSIGSMTIYRGTVNNSGSAYIGATSGKLGRVEVNGGNSVWNNATGLYLGAQNATTNGGLGILYAVNGGRVQIGNDAFDSGTTAELVVGDTVASNGTLTIRNGSIADIGGNSYLGATNGTTGSALVTGTNSRWFNSLLTVGGSGNGTLNVENGGYVSSGTVYIGLNAGSEGVTNVTGANSRLVGTFLNVAHTGAGTLNIENGGNVNFSDVVAGVASGSSGSMKISGANSNMNISGLTLGNAGTATMNVENGGSVSNTTGYVGFNSSSNGTVNVSGNGSRWSNSKGVFLGAQSATVDGGNGALNIMSGGRVQVGDDSFDSGTNSELVISDLNAIADGTLVLRNGSSIANDGSSYVAASANSLGSALVSGTGSRWENSGDLYVGRSGAGNLSVENGGVVENNHGHIASHGDSSTATVTGAGSHWANAGNLSVGAAGVGNLNINDAGLVTVGGTTTIGADDNVTLSGGRFEFGTSSLSSFARMGGSSGELAGLVTNTAFTNISTLTTLQSNSLDISEVNVSNSGTIVGTGSILAGFTNNTTGRVDVSGSSTMRFEGDNNSNSGRINSTGGLLSLAGNLTNTGTGRITNLGGQVVSEGQVTNMASGLISGRGEFTAEGGFQNHGTMAFSGGFADVVGDVHNFAGSLIVTSGNATTTFFEDVVHNGAEIRTSADSATVFLGEVSGSGSFTGTGSVFFEGDLRPGNSPGIVSFGGDVILGSTAVSHFEIGGLMAGINGFDQLQITGDLFLNDSMLNVSFINSFSLGSNQQFLIAAVGGNVNGQFQGLSEGALVGNYSGTDLFITYSAGGGNGIALFSAVPEPSAILLVGGLIGFASLRRKRRTQDAATAAI